jgi:hypothetical protein
MCLPTHLAFERGACCLEVFAKPVPGVAGASSSCTRKPTKYGS